MLVTWRSTAPTVTTSRSAMAAFERPSAIKVDTSRSRLVRPASGPRGARPSDHSLDDLWIQRRTATRDAPDGLGEQRQIAEPVLEQVADPFRAVTDEL